MVKDLIGNNPVWIEDIPLNETQTASIFIAVKAEKSGFQEDMTVWRGIKNHQTPNAYDSFDVLGTVSASDFNHLKNRESVKRLYPSHIPVHQFLVQKLMTSKGDRSLIYMLPLQDKNNQIVGADLFEKKRTPQKEESTSFIGSISEKRYQELLQHHIPLETAHKHPYADENIRLVPDVSFALNGHHYQLESRSNCMALLAQKIKNAPNTK